MAADRRWVPLLLALGAGACGSPTGGRWAEGPPGERPPPTPRPVAAPHRVLASPAPAPADPGRPTPGSGPEPVGIELQFQGVGGLFQGFFADRAAVTALATELAPCIEGGLAVLVISWSEQTRIGSIALRAEPEMIGCKPGTGDTGLDMAPLGPIARALAHYRDAVSGSFDLRIASFRTGLVLLEGMNHCGFWLGGQYPPDGSTWSRCAEFAGQEHCMAGDRTAGTTRLRFDPPQQATARACFGL